MQFKLFSDHLDLAHHYWSLLLQPGDIAVDATCGNGLDCLYIAQRILVESTGHLTAFDIQETALEKTRLLLTGHLEESLMERIDLCQGCHSEFPATLLPESVALIVYNLGYLPGGGDKSLTTMTGTTLFSIQRALPLIKRGGAISITCYPGHAEGQNEETEIIKLLADLNPHEWNCCHHQWINRKQAPTLFFIQRRYKE